LLRTKIAALAAATTLAVPAANAVAAVQAPANVQAKKKVVTTSTTVSGSTVETDRWGPLQVQLVVSTTTTLGKKKKVKVKIKSVRVPVYPDHTDRSVFINQQALPMLAQEVLSAQSGNIQMISGATDTSYAFEQSLQAALLKLKA
jgi:uncharacterized protein with FMN-binding domain